MKFFSGNETICHDAIFCGISKDTLQKIHSNHCHSIEPGHMHSFKQPSMGCILTQTANEQGKGKGNSCLQSCGSQEGRNYSNNYSLIPGSGTAEL